MPSFRNAARPLLLGLGVIALCSTSVPRAAAQRAPRAVRVAVDTTPMDSARARLLYVSTRPEDLPTGDIAALAIAKHVTDSIYTARLAGVADFQRVTYRSSDGMEMRFSDTSRSDRIRMV